MCPRQVELAVQPEVAAPDVELAPRAHEAAALGIPVAAPGSGRDCSSTAPSGVTSGGRERSGSKSPGRKPSVKEQARAPGI